MVQRHSSRLARPRGRSLLSVDKNYARRIDTLYRKAHEAPGAIADKDLRSRCRLAVIQELDGVCSVFLTHNDASWPPSREDLKKFTVLNPRHFTTVDEVDSTLLSNPEGDTSEDDAFLGPETLDEGSNPTSCGLVQESNELIDLRPPIGLQITPSVEEHGVPSNLANETCFDLQVPHTPTKQVLRPVASSATPNRTATIDPAVFFTPPNKMLPLTPASSISPCVGASLKLSSMARLSARQRSSTPSSPPRRASRWGTQKNKVRAS